MVFLAISRADAKQYLAGQLAHEPADTFRRLLIPLGRRRVDLAGGYGQRPSLALRRDVFAKPRLDELIDGLPVLEHPPQVVQRPHPTLLKLSAEGANIRQDRTVPETAWGWSGLRHRHTRKGIGDRGSRLRSPAEDLSQSVHITRFGLRGQVQGEGQIVQGTGGIVGTIVGNSRRTIIKRQ